MECANSSGTYRGSVRGLRNCIFLTKLESDHLGQEGYKSLTLRTLPCLLPQLHGKQCVKEYKPFAEKFKQYVLIFDPVNGFDFHFLRL